MASLKKPDNMVELAAAREGRIRAAQLPPPKGAIPSFPYQEHLDTIVSGHWPPGTKSLSRLRLSLLIQKKSKDLLGRNEETVHLDIIDFPGEWLIDLTMMDKSFASWSVECLEKIPLEALDGREEAKAYLWKLQSMNTEAEFNVEDADSLAKTFTAYLQELNADGYSSCTPGRFLQPGDLENSPVLTFAPLYPRDKAGTGSLYKEFESRFEDYKKRVIQPFFEDHLSKIDRQVVLVDVMAAIENGPRPFEDQRKAMKEILSVFQPGSNLWFINLFQGHKVEKILFATTKADHLHHTQHAELSSYPDGVLRESVKRAADKGANTKVMSIAALRVTDECIIKKDGLAFPGVSGWVRNAQDKQIKWFLDPGRLPDIGQLLQQAKQGRKTWLAGPVNFPKFLPKSQSQSKKQTLPHIRLDQALEFLIGDLLC